MNALATRTGFHRVETMNIEQMLDELYAASFPNLFCSENNGAWSANTTMRIKVQGAEFTVRSDYGHKTPASALQQLLTRVRSAIHQLEQAQGGAA